MPICGGSAQRKPDKPLHIVVDPNQLGDLFPVTMQWLKPFLPYLPQIVLNVDELCDAQPTDQPLLESADLLTLITRNPWVAVAAVSAKVTQLVHLYMWYTLCECVGEATPAEPAGQAEPEDIPRVNPPDVAQPGSAPCAEWQEHIEDWNAGNGMQQFFNSQPGAHIATATGTVIPPGTQHVKLAVTSLVNGDSNNLEVSLGFSNANNNPVSGGSTMTVTPGTTNTLQVAVAATAVVFYVHVDPWDLNPPRTAGVHMEVEAWCGAVGSQQTPCCPPDAQLRGMLEQVLQAVTLIQRQGVPFAYVPQGEDTGLSGSGELLVDGLLAVTVLFTTLPGHFATMDQSPDVVFDAGWLALGTADGYGAPQRIRTSPFFLRVGAEVTKIGYTLAPGIVATIKRHVREP